MTWKKSLCATAAAGLLAGAAQATPNLKITELMSKSDATEDWFEITNFGDSAANIAGWSFDDESADVIEKTPISGVTSIAAGESVVILQLGNNNTEAAEIQAFRDFWGGIDGIQIGSLSEAASGMGKGDGVTIFDSSDNVALQQFYGDGEVTDPGELIDDTHAGVWAGGEEWDSANFTGSGWVAGSAFEGQFGIFASAQTNGEGLSEFGSPGTAVPEPGSLALLGLGGLALLGARRRRA